MGMMIAIPTFMREEKQKCWNAMPNEIKAITNVVTHSGRLDELQGANPGMEHLLDLGKTDGIADVRQKLIEKAASNGIEKIMIIDDSCTFKARNAEMKLVDMTLEDWRDMFAMVETMLDDYPMVGISDQGGNNRVTEDFVTVGRSYSCYGLNIKKLNELGVRFDGMYQKDKEIKLYEDFYLILSLLTLGEKNAIIYKYAFNHPHGKPGGNSTVRTNELQKKCLEALSNEFPGLVKLVKKEDPSWKAGLNDTENFRWEAVISWSEAFKRGEASKDNNDLMGALFG